MSNVATQFKKGKSGNPAGRKLGSKNKLNRNVDEICSKFDCNPFEILALIATGKIVDCEYISDDQKKYFTIRLMMEAASELAQYLAPKLKSIEHKGDKENPVNFNIILGD